MAPSATTPLGVWLEVDLDAQPIEGTLRLPGEAALAFIGWLGLTTALDGLRERQCQLGLDGAR